MLSVIEAVNGAQDGALYTSSQKQECDTGGKEAFVWGAIWRLAVKQKGPVALFVTDAHQTICRSQERYSAFRSTLMGADTSDPMPASPAGASPAGSDELV